MKRVLLVLTTALALVGAACGASGDENASEEDEGSTPTTEASGSAANTFGDLESPCGDGDYTIADGEQGAGADKFYIGVGNDRSAQVRPGLNKELWDASVAFAEWCNEQGGLGGLPIELVDLDAQLFQVEAAMSKACTGVFAMVGGAMTQDQLQFSGKDGSDFHKCKLIDIPAFAVSVEKGLSNGQVQPIPNPQDKRSLAWMMQLEELYPEEMKKNVVVFGELPSIEVVKKQFDAGVQEMGGIEALPAIQYPVAGVSDWTPYAQKVIESGATSVYWVGEPGNASSLAAKLAEQNWEGLFFSEANVYDPLLFSAGDEGAEGAAVRIAVHPFEEADKWPAVKQYQENVEKYVDGGKQAALGLQSTSAWLLFATAVNACAEADDNVVSRECVLEEAAAISDWTGGGMHVPTDPGGEDPPECSMLVVAKDGAFERLYPELGGEGDDQDGFNCPEDSIAEVTEDLGAVGAVDPSRPG